MERPPENLESPCKGPALAAGEGRDSMTWQLVLIIPGLSMLLPADSEMRGIPLPSPKAQCFWPPQACQGAIEQKFQLQSP